MSFLRFNYLKHKDFGTHYLIDLNMTVLKWLNRHQGANMDFNATMVMLFEGGAETFLFSVFWLVHCGRYLCTAHKLLDHF